MLRIVMCFLCLGYFSSCRLIPLEPSQSKLTEKQAAAKRVLQEIQSDETVSNDLYQNGLFVPQLNSPEHFVNQPYVEKQLYVK